MRCDPSLVSETPFQVALILEDLLFAFQPNSHLCVLIAVVGCTVCVLCQINVEALRVFGVVVVRCAEQLNRLNIVNQGVKLGQVEVLANAELNKDVFIGVKIMEGPTKELQGFGGVHRVLSEVEKVEQSSSGPNKGNWGCAIGEVHINNESKEDPAHVSMFFSSEAGKRGDSLRK